MEPGASQCIHDLLPGRRVELQRKSSVALTRWQMLYLRGGERGPVDGLAFQRRLTSGHRLWRYQPHP